MVLTPNIASLNLVKGELDATLAQVEAALEAFVEERESVQHLDACVEGLDQIYGCLRLIELNGAAELGEALAALGRRLKEQPDTADDRNLAAIGNALMVLGRYLEYVQIRQLSWPQLLVPTINQVRIAMGLPELAEGWFLHLDVLPQPPVIQEFDLAAADFQPLVKRLRLMYQTGLLAVLRDSAQALHFRLLERAVARVRQLADGRRAAVQWWVVQAMIEALADGVAINGYRKQLLGRLDRDFRQLLKEGPALFERSPDLGLLQAALYVVGLGTDGKEVLGVREAFDLEDRCLTQVQMTQEYETMCGPGGSVIRTVADVMRDELAHVKDALDVMSRGAHVASDQLQSMADSLVKTAHTLVMLGLTDASQAVKAQAEQVRQWQEVPNHDQLQALVDVLLDVDNAVTSLVKQVTPGGTDTPILNQRISIHQLDEARAMLVAESRSGLSLVKRAITSYLESQRDLMHLTNVPGTLQSVAGGLAFLDIPRGAGVLRTAGQFIDKRMLSSEEQPAMDKLETFADAISSVDYYLESLEAGKPVGESILDIAEDSMASLGFAVDRIGR